MREKKYIKGDPLTFYKAVEHLLHNRYIFERNKPQHPGWVRSWSVQSLLSACSAGIIFEAKLNPRYKEKMEVSNNEGVSQP